MILKQTHGCATCRHGPCSPFHVFVVLGAHGRTPCLGLEKLLFLTTLCSESSLGVLMKVVVRDVSFPMALASPPSEVHNLSYE
jgi:hypothetical protein